MNHPCCNKAGPRLPAPDIPQTCRHGIGIRQASRLVVQIPVYPDMEKGDLIEVFWGDNYVASKILANRDLNQPASLRVPESFLENGKARVRYRVTKVGGMPQVSVSRKLWVKLDAPGGMQPGLNNENQSLTPLVVPVPVERQGLSARLQRDGLPVIIEPYPYMAAHDEITLSWGDLRMDLPPLQNEEVGEPLTIVVPPALIHEAGGERYLDATYRIIDRVGNHSSWAPPRSIWVPALEPMAH